MAPRTALRMVRHSEEDKGMRRTKLLRRLAPLAAVALPLLSSGTASAQTNTTAGTGAIAGTLNYTATTGIPVPPHPCVNNASWSFAVQTQAGLEGGAVVLELTNNEFVGVASLSGSATDTVCGDLVDDFGNMTSITVSGDNSATGSTLRCSSLTGSFIRAGVHLHMAYSGDCAINGNTAVHVLFALENELEPSNVPSANTLMQNFIVNGAFAVKNA